MYKDARVNYEIFEFLPYLDIYAQFLLVQYQTLCEVLIILLNCLLNRKLFM